MDPMLGVYKDMAEQQIKLREFEHARWAKIGRGVQTLAEELIPDVLEARRRSEKAVTTFTPEELLPLITEKVAILSAWKVALRNYPPEEIQKIILARAEMQKRIEELEKQLAEAKQTITALQEKLKSAAAPAPAPAAPPRQDARPAPAPVAPASSTPASAFPRSLPESWASDMELDNSPQPPPPQRTPESRDISNLPPAFQGVREDSLPAWVRDWTRSAGYRWDSLVLKIIGDTGEYQQNRIIQSAREYYGVSKNNRGPYDALRRLLNGADGGNRKGFPMVEKKQVLPRKDAEPVQVILLTESGKIAYQALAGKNPVPSLYEHIDEHKSGNHNRLVQDTVFLLEKRGYEVTSQSSIFLVEEGSRRTFHPDIVAEKDGMSYYIEVETAAPKIQRTVKWRNVRDFTDGNIYLVAQTKASQDVTLAEIRRALSGSRYVVRAFNFSEIPPEGADLWTVFQEY